MKTVYNYAFRIVCVYILVLMLFAVTSISIDQKKYSGNIVNANLTKELESRVITKQEKKKETKETKVPVVKEETKQETVVQEEIKIEEKQSTYQYVQTVDTTSVPVMQEQIGNLSHYGHDCYGCTSGKTASGYDISDGRIYYTDATYGSVRIVAAGYEYPIGTILRLSNVEANPMIVIVLDRGGSIGAGKKYTLDLLAESNGKAYQLGTKAYVKIEVLRLGY